MDLSQYDTKEILRELKSRRVDISDPSLWTTEALISEIKDRLPTLLLVYQPPDAMRVKYAYRSIFNGSAEMLTFMIEEVKFSIMMERYQSSPHRPDEPGRESGQ